MKSKIESSNRIEINKQSEIISLFLQLNNNSLTKKCKKRVEKIINDCDECKTLYNEIQFFFNQQDTIVYELTHKKEILELRNDFKLFSKLHIADSLKMEEHNDCDSMLNELEDSFNNNECFYCGS